MNQDSQQKKSDFVRLIFHGHCTSSRLDNVKMVTFIILLGQHHSASISVARLGFQCLLNFDFSANTRHSCSVFK